MEAYGGGFVQQLASLARRADLNNLTKIKTTWSEYWEQYTLMVKRNNSKDL